MWCDIIYVSYVFKCRISKSCNGVKLQNHASIIYWCRWIIHDDECNEFDREGKCLWLLTKPGWNCHGLVDLCVWVLLLGSCVYECMCVCVSPPMSFPGIAETALEKSFQKRIKHAAYSSQPLCSSKLHLRQKARPNGVDLEDLGVAIEIKRTVVAWNLCSSKENILGTPQVNMLEKKKMTMLFKVTRTVVDSWSVNRQKKPSECSYLCEKDTSMTFWIGLKVKSKQHSHTKH